MSSSKIESLLKAANSSPDNDTSINIAKRTFVTDEDCRSFFDAFRSRMFRIDEWNKNSSATKYDLFEESGDIINSEPISVGKFIRIALYGGGKYDWVRVVEIGDAPDEVVVTVKPSYDASEQPPDTSKTSHFFGPEAENNFCLQILEKTLSFYVIGLK